MLSQKRPAEEEVLVTPSSTLNDEATVLAKKLKTDETESVPPLAAPTSERPIKEILKELSKCVESSDAVIPGIQYTTI